jgi:uncharacterized linocin/CFP29 family protein
MENVNIDIMVNGSGGSIANRLLANNMNPALLRPFIDEDGKSYVSVNGKNHIVNSATLRYDEWKHYDKAILQAANERLVGVADLVKRGLTYSLGNGLGTTVLQYEDAGKLGEAGISMDGLTRHKSDRPEYDMKYLPLPIVSSDWQINARALAASRNGSAPMDTVIAEQCARRVAEKLEDMLFTGVSSYAFGGGTIYGYLDFPSRQTGSMSVAWDATAATGATMLADVVAMKQKMLNAKKYGPYVLYIPTAYELLLDEDYSANYPGTIRERMSKISGISEIKVADHLTAGRLLMVNMASDTVRLVQGMGITPVQWDEQGGMVTQYKIMTIQVPQLRADQEGNCGIVVFS